MGFKSLLVFLVTFVAAEKNIFYTRRAALEDQAASSSGYVYHSDLNGPISYMQFNNKKENFGYPPVIRGQLIQAPIPYKYYQPLPLPPLENYGKKYEEQSDSSKGEKESSGFNKEENHEVVSKGEHEKEANSGYYNENGGNKKGDHEESGHHASEHEAVEKEEGGSQGESISHKKGSKTTGYHKIYHKDEYKKDHTFYDESDSKGYYDKYGSGHKKHSSKHGGFKNGGKSNSGHHVENFGKNGYYNKGHYHNNDEGYKGEEGNRKYYNDHSDYVKTDGGENSESYGYENKGTSIED